MVAGWRTAPRRWPGHRDDQSIVASGCDSLPVVTCDPPLVKLSGKRSPFDEQTLLPGQPLIGQTFDLVVTKTFLPS